MTVLSTVHQYTDTEVPSRSEDQLFQQTSITSPVPSSSSSSSPSSTNSGSIGDIEAEEEAEVIDAIIAGE